MHIKTDAIVLRAYDNGKNSKLLLLLTREYGRLAVTARGAGSLKSALCAASGQFCYASFVLFKNADRYTVESADIKELFFELRNDVSVLACAQYMAEIAAAVAQEGEGDEELLRVLLNCLYGMAKLKLAPALCKLVFELRVTACEGYLPDLDCEGAVGVDFVQGQAVASLGETVFALSAAALETLEEILMLPTERIFSFSASPQTQVQLSGFAERYLLAQTDLRPKTLEFLKTVL